MSMTALETTVRVVRFVGLLIAYVAVLAAIGVVRAFGVVYRRTIGRAFGTPPRSDLGDDPTDPPLSIGPSTADGDGIEEPTNRP